MAANDYKILRRNATNNNDVTYLCSTPAASASALFAVDGPANSGVLVKLGSNLQMAGGFLSVTGIPVVPPAPTVPVIKSARALTNSQGEYNWVFSTPFASGVIPKVTATIESASPLFGPNQVQVLGTPNATGAVVKASYVGLVEMSGYYFFGTYPLQTNVHLIATE